MPANSTPTSRKPCRFLVRCMVDLLPNTFSYPTTLTLGYLRSGRSVHYIPIETTPPLRSKSNKPLAMTTDDILNILVYYHLNEFSSGRELLQNLKEDEYVKHLVAPAGGVKRSTFFDTVNERSVDQLLHVFSELQKQAADILPTRHIELGELVAVDGSFIDSVLSMTWAEYQTQSNKAKLHLGFDLTHGIPQSLILTEGNGAERPQVSSLVQPGQTAVLDRGYQEHELFDQWQEQGRHFICRIKENTHKTVIEEFPACRRLARLFRR